MSNISVKFHGGGARKSNFELCRLVCMFCIVTHHLFIHNSAVTGDIYYTRALSTLFTLGVPTFVMLSGYFGIKRSLRGFLHLVAQVFFYSCIILLISKFVFHEPVEIVQILNLFRPATQSGYWFINTYILLFLVSPYLNLLLQTLSKRQYISMLVTLTVLVCYFGCVAKNKYCDERSLLMFCYLYSLGRFIRLYYQEGYSFPKIGNRPCLLFSVLCVSLFILISFLPFGPSKIINSLFSSWDRIGKLFMVILFVLCFSSLKIQSSFINTLAQSSFAIYLIHGNYIVTYHRWFYDIYSKYGVMVDNIHLKLLYLLVCAIVICVFCILVDRVRIFLFKIFKINQGIDWIDNKVRNIIS